MKKLKDKSVMSIIVCGFPPRNLSMKAAVIRESQFVKIRFDFSKLVALAEHIANVIVSNDSLLWADQLQLGIFDLRGRIPERESLGL